MKGVLLVNMPLAALDSPSLALGLFKARLRAEGFRCDVRQLNLTFGEMIGADAYDFLLRLPAIFAGEQLFARALFGDRLPSDREYYGEVLSEGAASPDVPGRLEYIRAAVAPFLRHCLDSIAWHDYDIIGFTSLFEQNLASLALASLVKQRWPRKIIVFGGANCEDVMGVTLLRSFPFLDFVCSGEADETFPELVKRLTYGHPVAGLRGLVYRAGGRTRYDGAAPMVEQLDTLPVPDYDDYFADLTRSPLRRAIRPSVLMESARGCWWGEKSHCTFCGLNGLTMRFRTKSVTRSLDEMERLIARYGPPIIRFTDNIMDAGAFKEFVPAIAARGVNATIIFEVKANLKKDQIRALAAAGMTVQAGIESLSTPVLKLMGKGSNALMNIQTLKWCSQYGVTADWNLLYGFPGEEPDDYRRSLELARVLTHLHAPSGCGPIRLDRFSPNFKYAGEKGFTNVRPMRLFRYLYPFSTDTLRDLVYYFDFDYRTPIDDGGYLPELERAVAQWKGRSDYLYVTQANGGLVVHDSRPVAAAPQTLVTGLAARVYECCDKARSAPQIEQAIRDRTGAGAQPGEMAFALDEFLRRKIMVKEDQRFLSLAVLTYRSVFEESDSPPAGEAPIRVASPLAAAGAPLHIVREPAPAGFGGAQG